MFAGIGKALGGLKQKLGGGGPKPAGGGGFGGFLSRPGMKERGALLQGAGQAMQGGGLGGLASGLKGFRDWKSQQRPMPGGARPGGWSQPQAQLPGSQMQAPQIDPAGGAEGFQAPPPLPKLGAPQLGGFEPSPWATQPPQPPKPPGGLGPSLGGRGGFMPPDNGGAFGSYGRGWGG